ncbi:MAG: response regulator transcription factor [Tabrizicola sp.]|nr:response regulator transcription factor [Tabrizicola sp.]
MTALICRLFFSPKRKVAQFFGLSGIPVDAAAFPCNLLPTINITLRLRRLRTTLLNRVVVKMTDVPKLIIVDEHEIVRDGIASLIAESECARVVGTASDGYTAIKHCRSLEPDMVLMDLGIIRPSGMETFRKIRSVRPETKIVIYSSDSEKTDIFSLLAASAAGFIPKQAKGSDFVNAIRCASLGYVCIPSEFMEEFSALRKNATKTGNVYGLSLREMEILEACVSGARTKEIADRLDISVRTVETHRNSIYRKTSCHSISDLIEVAARLQIVEEQVLN